MPQNTRKNADGGMHPLNMTGAWPAERWVAVVVLSALAMLILIRRGFRGVDVLGARVSVN